MYGDVLDLGRTQGLIYLPDELGRTDGRRSWRMLQVLTDVVGPAIEQALQCLTSAERAIGESSVLGGAARLVRRARRDVTTGVDLIVGGLEWPYQCVARDLMEVEWLLLDFANDPARIGQWVAATNKEHQRHFSPAALRKRLAASQHPGQDLADTLEYQAHSDLLHVTADSCDFLEHDDHLDDPSCVALRLLFADLVEHTGRALFAAGALAEVDPAAKWDVDDCNLDIFIVVAENLRRWQAELVEGLPEIRARAPLPPGFRFDDAMQELRSKFGTARDASEVQANRGAEREPPEGGPGKGE